MKYLVQFMECHGAGQTEFEVDASSPVMALGEACALLQEEGGNPLMYLVCVNAVEYPLLEGGAEPPEGCPHGVSTEVDAV